MRGRKFFYLLVRYYLRDRDGFIKIKERGQDSIFQDLERSGGTSKWYLLSSNILEVLFIYKK